MRGWTAKRKAELAAYVAEVAGRMGLTDWEIRIDWTPSPEGTCATITSWGPQRRATMRLAAGFLEESRVDQRDTIVHELVHCHLFGLQNLVADLCGRSMTPEAAELADIAITQQLELSTDSLAAAIAPTVPLPDLGVQRPTTTGETRVLVAARGRERIRRAAARG